MLFFFSAPYNADCEDPYPSLSDFHDYEPNLEFDDSDLLQQKHPENDDELELPEVDRQHTPNTYIESPMSDGTIEEDFEQALAREMVSDHRRGSGDHVNAGNVTIEGMYYVQKKITKENNILGVKKSTFSVFFFE